MSPHDDLDLALRTLPVLKCLEAAERFAGSSTDPEVREWLGWTHQDYSAYVVNTRIADECREPQDYRGGCREMARFFAHSVRRDARNTLYAVFRSCPERTQAVLAWLNGPEIWNEQ